MINLIRIESRRLLFTKVNAVLVISTLCFAYYVLSNYTILGSINTAPFSEWSYAEYLGRVMPFLLVILLFFETSIFSQKEKAVRYITLTTPLSIRDYFMVKTAAIILAWLPTAVLVIGLGFGFYAVVFQMYDFNYLLIPSLLILLPPAVFIYGVGLIAGAYHNNLIYFAAVTFFLIGITGFSILPAGWSLFSSNWIQTYPLSLPSSASGDIPFQLPIDFLSARFFWILIGTVLTMAATWKTNHKKEGV